jgi:hypothetical protein
MSEQRNGNKRNCQLRKRKKIRRRFRMFSPKVFMLFVCRASPGAIPSPGKASECKLGNVLYFHCVFGINFTTRDHERRRFAASRDGLKQHSAFAHIEAAQ